MEIKRSGSRPSGKGPSDYFTGAVRIDPLFQAPDPARVAIVHVTFEPGARTAWHTHPLGPTVIITSGCGWAQRWGGPDLLDRATWSGSLRAKSTGMGRPPQRRCPTSPSRSSSTARPPTGWRKSAKSSTGREPPGRDAARGIPADRTAPVPR